MDILISVIMPLYNAEKYLAESLTSVLKQTLLQFELICINDASTDGTLDILREFQKRDNRIKIILNEEHSGAAYSRNEGIKVSRGAYLSFLDGDDIFEEEMLEAAYNIAKRTQADIVLYELLHVPSEQIYIKKQVKHGEKYIEEYCQHPFSVKEKSAYEVLNWSASPCDKLFRRQFVIDNKLEFQTLQSSNDLLFVNLSLMLAQKIIFSNNNKVMVYARDHNVPTRISFDRDPMCSFLAMKKLQEELLERGRFEEFFQHFFYRLFFSLKYALEKTKDEKNARSFYDFLKTKGIRYFRDKSGKYYNKIDSYVKELIEMFEMRSFEEKWYENISVLTVYLEKNINSVNTLYQDCIRNNRELGIWGAGKNGYVFLKFCHCHKMKIKVIIDIDKKKQGNKLFGCPIVSPEKSLKSVKTIIVTGRQIYDSVLKEVKDYEKDIVLIDLDSFLGTF